MDFPFTHLLPLNRRKRNKTQVLHSTMEEGTIFITIFSSTMKSSIAIMILLLLPLSSSIEAHIKGDTIKDGDIEDDPIRRRYKRKTLQIRVKLRAWSTPKGRMTMSSIKAKIGFED